MSVRYLNNLSLSHAAETRSDILGHLARERNLTPSETIHSSFYLSSKEHGLGVLAFERRKSLESSQGDSPLQFLDGKARGDLAKLSKGGVGKLSDFGSRGGEVKTEQTSVGIAEVEGRGLGAGSSDKLGDGRNSAAPLEVRLTTKDVLQDGENGLFVRAEGSTFESNSQVSDRSSSGGAGFATVIFSGLGLERRRGAGKGSLQGVKSASIDVVTKEGEAARSKDLSSVFANFLSRNTVLSQGGISKSSTESLTVKSVKNLGFDGGKGALEANGLIDLDTLVISIFGVLEEIGEGFDEVRTS